ncbi:MAG: hypothetical protein M0P91_07850 [Sulfuricurvum sp.]|uniref:hypothetical protein n=1 Tax=Sulfuricurvum sp. TaxID=2025608 RepID=UPI0025F79428|nr:hypothetical protein [Sulfuricurvum sp.]MCK9373097.1 hypothetical protein [Sulfuricurvum sp.]
MELITLILGGLIGFLSAIGKDLLLEKKKNQIKIKDFKRQKLEEIFLLMDQVTREAIKPLKYKDSLDGVGAKLGMIIRFYFPELNTSYDQFIQVFLSTSQKTMTYDDKISLSQEEILAYYEAHRIFLDKVVQEAKQYI